MTSAKVQTRFLAHTSEQVEATTRLYESGHYECHIFVKGNPNSQQDAQTLLARLGLDQLSRRSLDSRWNVQWSNSWPVGNEGDFRRRILFQCSCGYDTLSRQQRERQKQGQSTTPSNKKSERRVPYDFTGCLAHVEITERSSDGEITRVTGYSTHNDECKGAFLKRLPAIPLHEHVHEVALDQLENGASITSIQQRNREMIEQRAYRGMQNLAPETSNIRYHLLQSDNATLYRKFSRRHGVDVRQKPEQNIDDWLNPLSAKYQPAIRDAIFHYAARSNAGERFQVCISTSDMETAAWKHAHHSQLVLDGTFGVCSSRLLLFIGLARDEGGKGVPVVFFLFSAPTGNRATHAGYDTQILYELLLHWKTKLSQNSKTPFIPHVAITDTDTKERGALLRVWPNIILILCKFHVRQCWTNHRKTTMRCKGSDFWKDHVRNKLQKLESELIMMSDYDASQKLILAYEASFAQLLLDSASAAAGRGGTKHLEYLTINWMPSTIWQSWSEYGRIAASAILDIPVEGVIPTTNHLESFNAILKRKHLASALHSGHRLRFDSLIHLLITKILPGIFNRRKTEQDYREWLALRFRIAAGDGDITAIRHVAKTHKPLAWWTADSQRDSAAHAILQANLLQCFRPDVDTYTASCISSSSIPYDMACCRNGEASCSCPDFQSREGACKHMRALKLLIVSWITTGSEQDFKFPQTRIEAEHCSIAFGRLHNGRVVDNSILPTGRPSALSPFIKWDPVLIQALGNDSTTVDNSELEEASNSRSSAADLDTTDSGDDSDYPAVTTEAGRKTSVVQVDPGNKHQNLQLANGGLAAVRAQLEAKIRHNVHNILPRLYGLANNLDDIQTLEEFPGTDELEELSNVLSQIQLRLPAATRSKSHQNQNTVLTSQPLHDGRTHQSTRRGKRPLILPPSPERRQKRKDSHAPL